MSTVANVLVALVALLHLYFLVLEMFLWDKPAGLRAFGHTPKPPPRARCWPPIRACTTAFSPRAWLGLSLGAAGTPIKVFFLLCVLVAGLYGAATASRKILFVQALPALVAHPPCCPDPCAASRDGRCGASSHSPIRRMAAPSTPTTIDPAPAAPPGSGAREQLDRAQAPRAMAALVVVHAHSRDRTAPTASTCSS